MFVWSWISASISDPGRITDDLKRKGLLDKIQNGQIPSCLKNLPICYICQVPMPPNSHHCHKCNACQLSYDHHCGFIGNCIADKNTKSFYLSFFYGSIYGMIWAFFGIYYFIHIGKNNTKYSSADRSKLRDSLVLLASVYVGMISFSAIAFRLADQCNVHTGSRKECRTVKRMRKFTFIGCFQIIKHFLFNFLMKLIPIQNESSQNAWPGISWPNQNEI